MVLNVKLDMKTQCYGLELAEYRNPTKNSFLENDNLCVEMRDTSYSWEVLKEKLAKKKGSKKSDINSANKTDEDKNGEKFTEIPTLFNIDLKIEKGSLTGVAGLVGSGKSSLLSAILGEVRRLNQDYPCNPGSISDEVNKWPVKCQWEHCHCDSAELDFQWNCQGQYPNGFRL